MDKVNKAVVVYTEDKLDNVLMRISTDYEIPIHELKKYVDVPTIPERKRCIGKLKNGKPCNHHIYKDLEYCLKHKYQMCQEDSEGLHDEQIKPIQCTAINKNGQRCIRISTMNDVCGLHRFIGSASKMNSNMTKCAYYDDDDNQNHIFCNQYTMKNIWFCKNHSHHQNVYVHQYRAKNINHYKDRVQNNEIQENAVIEEILNR